MDEKYRQMGNNEHWTIPIRIYLIFCTFSFTIWEITKQDLFAKVVIRKFYFNKISHGSVSPINSICYILNSLCL